MDVGGRHGVLIAGASAAGVSAARELRRAGYTGPVTLLDAEGVGPYRRPPLSREVLTGTAADADLRLALGEELGVTVVPGATATGLDPVAREVTCADGAVRHYEGLVIATGAEPVHPWRGRAPAGVHLLRTLTDARALRDALLAARRVAVIGAGFIGAEVAAAARGLGRTVTLIDTLPTPHAATLGTTVGEACAALHRAHGTHLRLGTTVTGFTSEPARGSGAEVAATGRADDTGSGARHNADTTGEGMDGRFTGVGLENGGGLVGRRVTGVVLENGEHVVADLVVVGVGVRPATGWLAGSGVAVGDGVVCDATCAVLGEDGRVLDGVVAAGDVARWRHAGYGTDLRVEHWDNAVAQGRAAARTLLGDAMPYEPTPYFWSDQYDTKIQAVGVPDPGDEVTIAEGDPDEHRFVAVYARNGQVTAAVAMNLPRRLGHYRRLVQAGAPLSATTQATT